MQKLLLLVLVAFLITSCTNKFARIYETKTITDMTMDNGYYHFQNDTFSIHYSFWANKGVLSYTIYNKLNIPVYLDWKKSSFVKNNEKFDYWMDELNTNTLSYYRGNALSGVYYTGLDLIPILTASSGRSSSVSKTKATKPERITFLAPKSQIFKAQFIIYNNEPKEMNGFITSSIDNPLNAKKKIDIKSVKFNLNNSPPRLVSSPDGTIKTDPQNALKTQTHLHRFHKNRQTRNDTIPDHYSNSNAPVMG